MSPFLTKTYYIYILASRRNGTLYIGMTGNLEQRIYQHLHGIIEGFTKKYNIKQLVYYEETNSVERAIAREKQLKKWNRDWKLELIESHNPSWRNLVDDIFD